MKRRDHAVSKHQLESALAPVRRAMRPTLMAVATCALAWGCQPAAQQNPGPIGSSEQPIVGGKPAHPRSYPWMVTLFEIYKSKPYFTCGGTLIDPTHVLTAAHCSLHTVIDNEQHQFVTAPIDPANVVVAQRPRSLAALEPEDYIEVRDVVVDPEYDGRTGDHDIAVWELERPVELGEYPRLMTKPVVLDWLSALHLPARVLGYGALGEEDESSDVLRQVDIPLVPRAQCRAAYAQDGSGLTPEEIITEQMICAGARDGSKDACYGDSGGPLLLPTLGKAPLLAGVVSWGAACGDPNFPGVYANVATMADYIGACQDGECESRAPERDCDFDWVDCDANSDNGCETAPLTAATCGPSCGAPACGEGEACIIGRDLHCAPAKPVIPSVNCVVKEPDEFGEYLGVFNVLNQNEGSIFIPLAHQQFTDGAQPLFTLVGIPPGLAEGASLVILDRPDAGTYGLLGPDGQTHSASVTADTPACVFETDESLEQRVARLARAPGVRVSDTPRARRAGLIDARSHR